MADVPPQQTDSTQQTQFDHLMAELAAGSEAAAWEIAERYTPYIIRAVRATLPARIRGKVDSQDFAQAVWASLLLRRTRLTHMRSPQHLVAFLAAVSKHKVIDACRHYLGAQKYNVRRETSLAELAAEDNDRRERRLGSRGLEAPDPTPSRIASVRERWNHVVEQSSKRDRNIIALRIEGKTYHAISANLGISKATVQRVLARLIGEMLE